MHDRHTTYTEAKIKCTASLYFSIPRYHNYTSRMPKVNYLLSVRKYSLVCDAYIVIEEYLETRIGVLKFSSNFN
jgi:hypothetical protein